MVKGRIHERHVCVKAKSPGLRLAQPKVRPVPGQSSRAPPDLSSPCVERDSWTDGVSFIPNPDVEFSSGSLTGWFYFPLVDEGVTVSNFFYLQK